MMLQSLEPGTGSLWAGSTPGLWTPVAFGQPWHLGMGWVLSQVFQAAESWHPNSPTITTEESGEPLSGEPGKALGSVFGVQLVAVVGSWGQEPLALTQPLF